MSKRIPWTDEERKFLVDNYATMGTKACAIKMGRSIDSVMCAAHKLNLRFDGNKGVRFTEDEDTVIRESCASGDSVAAIAKRLGRNYHSVFHRLRRLGLQSGIHCERWSDDEDIFLSQNYKTLGSSGCAEKLGRSQTAVIQRFRKIRDSERNEDANE